MPYLNNIPQATDQLRNSQPALLGNFIAIKQLIDVDHSTFGAATEGKHNKVTMPIRAVAPATIAGEVGLYSANGIYGTPALFFKPQNSPAGTAGIDFTTANHTAAGWCQLPSGTIFAWGIVNMAGNSASVINTAALFAHPALNIQLTLKKAAAGVWETPYVQALGVNSFTIYNNNAVGIICYWLAVGY